MVSSDDSDYELILVNERYIKRGESARSSVIKRSKSRKLSDGAGSECENKSVKPNNRRKNKKNIPKGTAAYKQHRDKNNDSVRKTREKKKRERLEAERRIHALREDNAQLEKDIDALAKTMSTVREAMSSAADLSDEQLKKIYHLFCIGVPLTSTSE